MSKKLRTCLAGSTVRSAAESTGTRSKVTAVQHPQYQMRLTSVLLWRGRLSPADRRELELLARLPARTRCTDPVADTRKCIKEASINALCALADDPGALIGQPLIAPSATKAPNGLSYDPANYLWNSTPMILV